MQTVVLLFFIVLKNLSGYFDKLIHDSGTRFPVNQTDRPAHIHLQRNGAERMELASHMRGHQTDMSVLKGANHGI